ncbi:DUF2502 domain-containing protein [Jeongeupia naejangsanensis]|uniref:DUF2502 domain-containing protein n=1 Tax=Jeongeupia naejangsanensis TaxID=613195 RepID=A0ABS2BK62_9NEIS|nr:DUF2502 domain-containing protein [Jeongeupia naejangsanensis]MBM3115386.1 DUF2502 domain-containing protein [Jeongeupia naejangsanensis]
MKKLLITGLLAALPLAAPLFAHASDVNIGISVPGVSVYIGDRDDRGYYWYDGRYRDPSWWNAHPQYHPKYGYRNPRGYYWDGGRYRDEKWWKKNGKYDSKHKHHDHDDDRGYHCPPGQAKKGNC